MLVATLTHTSVLPLSFEYTSAADAVALSTSKRQSLVISLSNYLLLFERSIDPALPLGQTLFPLISFLWCVQSYIRFACNRRKNTVGASIVMLNELQKEML